MKIDGKNHSILTDNDMMLLADKASSITLDKNNSFAKNSYFSNSEAKNSYPFKCFEYGFQNAAELRKILSDMWSYQKKENMKELIPNCLASVYKYFDRQEQEEEKSEISPFIYEF